MEAKVTVVAPALMGESNVTPAELRLRIDTAVESLEIHHTSPATGVGSVTSTPLLRTNRPGAAVTVWSLDRAVTVPNCNFPALTAVEPVRTPLTSTAPLAVTAPVNVAVPATVWLPTTYLELRSFRVPII